MNIHWRHIAEMGCIISPRYFDPSELFNFSDQYFEDYCILHPSKMKEIFITKTLGVRSCSPVYCRANQYQPNHSIHFILSGKGTFNNMVVKEGDIVYCKPHIPYSISASSNNPFSYAWITFEGEFIEKYLRYMGLLNRFSVYQSNNITKIYSILYNLLYNKHESQDICMYYDATLLQILSLSLPSMSARKEIEMNAKRITDPRLQQALKYISEHYSDQKFRVKQVSDFLNISEQYLSKLFRHEFGISILEYAITLRLDEAKTLLQKSLLNVNEIAEKIGYENYYHFSTIFKKQFGYSPKQYRTIFRED